MQTVQRTLGVSIVRHSVGVLEFSFDVGFVLVRQVLIKPPALRGVSDCAGPCASLALTGEQRFTLGIL